VRKGLLYLGTENAIYVSFNDGRSWLPIQNNLPHAPVSHMVVQTHFNDLVVGTYGRGFWIMDDITPLEQLTDEVLKADAHLFKPRPAYRLHSIAGGPQVEPEAFVNYYLKDVPKEGVSIAILDREGKTVKALKGTRIAGINRVVWDLRYEGPQTARLRTRPPGNPHVVEEKRFLRRWETEGWYPIQAYGTRAGFLGPWVEPGSYTVKLTVGGREFSQALEVRKDPKSAGTVADIREQVKLQLAVREDQNTVSRMINRIEWMRKELGTLREALQAGRKTGDTVAAVDAFETKLRAVEDELFQPILAEGDAKSFRAPHKLYMKYALLATDLGTSVDFTPNRQQREVYAVLKERLELQKKRYEDILKTDLPLFNNMLKENNIAGIIVPDIK
jgi:hypothetical protein